MDYIPSMCPCCNSDKWVMAGSSNNKSGFSLGKAAVGGLLLGPVGLLAGTLGKKHTYITKVCQKCGFSCTYQIK